MSGNANRSITDGTVEGTDRFDDRPRSLSRYEFDVLSLSGHAFSTLLKKDSYLVCQLPRLDTVVSLIDDKE